jgi:DMSO/TMAO reductase YedYZ heme-binding membrane subunit
LTSFDYWQKVLGKRWRQIHLLTVPAMILAATHAMLIGSSYLGELVLSWDHQMRSIVLGIAVLAVLWVRSRWIWALLSREQLYVRSGDRKV